MIENVGLRKKICLLGDPAVGKTSLIRKYVYNQFSERYVSTIGTEVTKKEILVEYKEISKSKTNFNNYDLTFAIWDIIGQKEYRALISRFYKNASGALLVCDLSREDTFQNLKQWISSLFGAIGKVPIVLVGNKFDLVNNESFEPDELLEFSCRYGAPWITASARNGNGVEQAFLKLGHLIVKNTIFFEKMNSLIDVLDAIIVDFCEVNGGLELGMPLFKEAFNQIPGANLKEPRRDVVDVLINHLTKVTELNMGRDIAEYQGSRFNNWLKKVN